MPVTEKIRNWVFHQVHENNLVYNTCWEDPRCDRELLDLDQDSNVVMITSAGCNALSYLLDQPQAIHCIDVNPRQNALLELKTALLRHTDHDTLFQFFGKGQHADYKTIYWNHLRKGLGEYASQYWDKNIKFFSPRGLRKNFYYNGGAGTVAWLLSSYMKSRKKLFREVRALFEAGNLAEQKEIYDRIEPKFLNKLTELVLNRHLTMSFLGVPRSQQELFATQYIRGATGFIQECLRHVFTKIPIADNYFYRVYVYGEYEKNCCPDYLKETHFQTIQQQTQQLHTYSTTITNFLKENPGTYSHFVLLDHQDWLANHNPDALEEEWELIFANSQPGTKILLRSAAGEVDFFPDFVLDRLVFEQQKTEEQHHLDRVGTYASVYLATVS